MRAATVVAILLHAVVFALLLVRLTEQPEQQPVEQPPSPVAMVFESGQKQKPSSPNPTEETKPVTPAPEPTPSNPEPPVPETPPAPQPQPQPPPAPKAETPPSPPSEPAPQPEPPPPVPASPEPQAPPPVPAPPVPQAPPPPPPVPNPEVPLPPPPPPARPAPAPRPPPPSREAVRPRPPSGSSGFPVPQDYSLSSPHASASSPTRQHNTRHNMSIDMSLGPTIRGMLNNAPQGEADNGGPDYGNLLSQWVAEHAFYPEEAARQGEQGDAKVHVEADHFGHVKEVQLIGRSGSIFLDQALTALFRDRTIPPSPLPGNEPLEFNFTMRYIIRRSPGY